MVFVVTDSIVWSTTASKMSPLQIIHTIEGTKYVKQNDDEKIIRVVILLQEKCTFSPITISQV